MQPQIEGGTIFMESIKKYVNRFFDKKEIRKGYDICTEDWRTLSEKAKESPGDATIMSFLFGYAKGYRASKAEMKQKGGASA